MEVAVSTLCMKRLSVISSVTEIWHVKVKQKVVGLKARKEGADFAGIRCGAKPRVTSPGKGPYERPGVGSLIVDNQNAGLLKGLHYPSPTLVARLGGVAVHRQRSLPRPNLGV
jgi:hypothetical protein